MFQPRVKISPNLNGVNQEIGFEEKRTSALVAERLESFGLDNVHTGLAGTGLIDEP